MRATQIIRERWDNFRGFRWLQFAQFLVGAALASAMIVVLLLGYIKLSDIGYIRNDEYTLRCYFDKGLGLRVGTKVQVNGVEVGKVQGLSLTPDSRVELRVSIKREYQRWITTDARVYATRDQNLIAERIVNIEVPSGRAPDASKVLPDGGELWAGEAHDIETVIEKAVTLLQRVDTLTQKANTLLNMTLDTSATLGALISSRELYDQLIRQIAKVDQITTQTSRTIGALDQRLPPMLDGAERLLSGADQLLVGADSLIGSLGNVSVRLDTLSTGAIGLLRRADTTFYAVNSVLLDLHQLTQGAAQLMSEGESKIEKADDLMSSVGSFWLIRRSLPQKDTVPLFGVDPW